MHIFFLAQRVPYPPNKGEKIRTFHQLKYLCSLGHNVSFACPLEQSDDLSYLKQLKKRLPITTIFTPLHNKIFRYIKGILYRQPLSVSHFYSKNLQHQINLLFAKQDIDVIICSSSSLMEYIFQAQKKQPNILAKPINIIVDFMDLDSDKWQQYAKNTTVFKKTIYQREANLLKKYEHKIQENVNYCLFTSQAEVNLFNQQIKNPHNVMAIGNGLDTDYFKPLHNLFNEQALTFIFTGVMDYFPNEDAVQWFVTKIWPRIKEQYKGARFIIAGMNPTAKVVALASTPGVIVTGFVEDIRDYYSQADIFVAPLRIARGVQNKVLQSFACNLPVVSTPNATQGIDCLPEIHLLEADTEDEFIQQINRLVNDASLRHKLATNALQLVEKSYSWQGQLQQLNNIINQ